MSTPTSERPERLRTVHIGLGPIGLELLAAFHRTPGFEPVAAVDVAPTLVGADLAALHEGVPSLTVTGALPDGLGADVAVVAATSEAAGLVPLVRTCAGAGLHVVTTCEELAYPWVRHPDTARTISEVAEGAGVVVVAGGINPGYLLDVLPAVLAWPLTQLRRVLVRRLVDTGHRRGPLVRKTGAGLSRQEFEDLAAGGRIGHMGLVESADMLAAGLGSRLVEPSVTLEPVLTDTEVRRGSYEVPAGRVAGQRQRLLGRTEAGVVIEFELVMALTVEEPVDEIRLDGDPPLEWRARGGINGDTGTVGAMVQLARVAPGLQPGLRTMLDLWPARLS